MCNKRWELVAGTVVGSASEDVDGRSMIDGCTIVVGRSSFANRFPWYDSRLFHGRLFGNICIILLA